MNKNSIRYFALAVMLTLTSFSFQTHAKDATRATLYDAKYLDSMTQHHRDGIKMMQMATEKAQSADIRQMAEKGVNDQTMEVEEMASMRKQLKGGKSVPANTKLPGTMPKKDMDRDMAELKAAKGSHFDKHFLEVMIRHHQGAVKMSDAAMAKAHNAEVRDKAREIHDKQKDEISQMQSMLN